MKWLLLACLGLTGCVTKQDRALLNIVSAQQKVESTQLAKVIAQQDLLISVTLLMVDSVQKVEQSQTRISDEAASKEFRQKNQ